MPPFAPSLGTVGTLGKTRVSWAASDEEVGRLDCNVWREQGNVRRQSLARLAELLYWLLFGFTGRELRLGRSRGPSQADPSLQSFEPACRLLFEQVLAVGGTTVRKGIFTLVAIVLAVVQLGPEQFTTGGHPGNELVKGSDVKFVPLNPARGQLSPKAGKLLGYIRADVPSGILVKFAHGFESPPHIHNITYRAVVISGVVHNDDPAAEKMWMESGSFWPQPLGETTSPPPMARTP